MSMGPSGGGPLFGGGGFFGGGPGFFGQMGPGGPYGAWPGCGCSSLLMILAGIFLICAGVLRNFNW
jgi:hypothetical protein